VSSGLGGTSYSLVPVVPLIGIKLTINQAIKPQTNIITEPHTPIPYFFTLFDEAHTMFFVDTSKRKHPLIIDRCGSLPQQQCQCQ